MAEIPERIAHAACRPVRAAAGIGSKVTAHVRRHDVATHLLANGVDIRVMQMPPGHADRSTTRRDTHVSQGQIGRTASPREPLTLEALPPA